MWRYLLRDREPPAQEAAPLDVVRRESVERLPVERHGVLLRPAALGLLGRRDEVLDGALVLAGAAPVPGERAAGLADLGRRFLDELRDVPVALRAGRARGWSS